MAQGKGISEKVRQITRDLISNDLADQIYQQAKPKLGAITSGTFRLKVRSDKGWKRINRVGNGAGFTRTYRCEGVPEAAGLRLEVRSNKADTFMTYFAFRANGKYVAGWNAEVASLNVSTSKKDQIHGGAIAEHEAASDPRMRQMTAEELESLNMHVAMGDESMFDRLFEERE